MPLTARPAERHIASPGGWWCWLGATSAHGAATGSYSPLSLADWSGAEQKGFFLAAQVHVKLDGDHIPGSTFHVHVDPEPPKGPSFAQRCGGSVSAAAALTHSLAAQTCTRDGMRQLEGRGAGRDGAG